MKLYQSPKDKFLPYSRSETGNKSVAETTGRTALLGDRRRSDKHDLGDREAVPGHQGGAVVPDEVAAHEEIRPGTHLLVRTEVSK